MNENTISTTHALSRGIVRNFVALGVLLMLALLATVHTGVARGQSPADPTTPALTLSELEHAVALELSNARQNPKAMADDLKSAKHDGSYSATLPSGVTISTLPDFLTAAESEARSQPALNGLRWSETLAQAAREWAPYYNSNAGYSNFKLAHGCAVSGMCYDDRIARAQQRVNGKLGSAIEAIATAPMYGKSFAYTWWISRGEWTIGSPTNPRDPGGSLNRGHRGIIGDIRMNAVGVGCAWK